MNLPKRADTHITDTAALRILQNAVPDNWILRGTTERDYGVDAYLEFVNDKNEVTGDQIAIQLKGTSSIEWKGEGQIKTSLFSGIRTSTVNYWMNLSMPVFLFVADVSKDRVHFCPVKTQVRKRYDQFLKQETFSFNLQEPLDLATPLGQGMLEVLYFREKNRDKVEHEMVELITHAENYCDFIEANMGRDPFMEVEDDRRLKLIRLMSCCRLLAAYFDVEWQVMSLTAAYREDRKTWNHNYVDLLHEHTLSKMLAQVVPVYAVLLKTVLKVVREHESGYWMKKQSNFYNQCNNYEFEKTMEQIEERFSQLRVRAEGYPK